MADTNRAEVKIYGRQYTIVGSQSSDEMKRVSGYVDDVMNQLAKGMPSLSTLSLAVLAAVNIASELLETFKLNQSQAEQIAKMKEDAERYSQLWEDAKASLLKYQEETKDGVEQLQELQRIFNMKNEELSQMKEAFDELTAKYEDVEKQLQEAESGGNRKKQPSDGKSSEKLKKLEAEKQTLQTKVAELEKELEKEKSCNKDESQGLSDFREKYKELENSFFDIQMENIMLKNELDEFKQKQ